MYVFETELIKEIMQYDLKKQHITDPVIHFNVWVSL